MTDQIGIAPNDFWSGDKRPSQRLYFALCQFASAVLDYATGLDLPTRKVHPEKNTVWQAPLNVPDLGNGTEGVQSQPRLNWAATAFYYSLVHAGRFFVFMPVGDFPKQHDLLPLCFGYREGDSRATKKPKGPKKTNWLGTFAGRLVPPVLIDGRNIDNSSQGVFSSLLHFWGERLRWQECDGVLRWFGETLERARNLRNENNYESLLIAHEHNHDEMTEAFHQLARCIRDAARKALSHASAGLRLYMCAAADSNSKERWDISPDDKLAFAASFLEDRVHDPVSKWYGTAIANQIREILDKAEFPSRTTDETRVRAIWRDVSRDVFDGKRCLLRKFREDIGLLRTLSESG